ncbi:thioesterase family protein [Xylogone sp. PMI_703]|nr:thioesterase family protein [Xylogone sp. PMI_703]
MATRILTDEETLEVYKPVDTFSREIDMYIRTHPLSEKLRTQPNFSESRPHLKIPDTFRSQNLTAGTLSGPNRIVVPPYMWLERSGRQMIAICYLGSDLCGHPGIVHSGLLATLLEEAMAQCCSAIFLSGIGVTASMNIRYRALVRTNNYVVLKALIVKVEDRKAWVDGRLETLSEGSEQPVVFVEAKGLLIEPMDVMLAL